MNLNLSIEEREMLPKCPFVYTLYTSYIDDGTGHYDEKRVPFPELSTRMKHKRFYTSDMYTHEGYKKRFKNDPPPPKKCIIDGKVYDIDMIEVITTY